MSRRNAVVAALVVLILAVGAVIVLVRDDGGAGADRDDARAVTTQPSSATTAPGTPNTIEAVVPQLQQFVERRRGLTFKSPVKVTALEDAAFRQRLEAERSEDVREIEDTEAVLRAVGLLEGDVDLAAALASVTGDLVAGYYDPEAKELVVRGAEPTPYVRRVLVHELTHALDDQWFGLDRPGLDAGDSEAQAGFDALVEGSASVVELAYHGDLPDDERTEADREELERASSVDADIPPVLLSSIAFPYERGPLLVRTILGEGGTARLDEAFRSPPRSTEQVIHPERYLSRDAPRPPSEPRADRPPFQRDVIGELSLLQMLQVALPLSEAQQAAEGWGGDRYVAWRDGARTCVRATFVTDTPQDAAELAGALRRYAAERPGSTVEGDGPTTLTTCG